MTPEKEMAAQAGAAMHLAYDGGVGVGLRLDKQIECLLGDRTLLGLGLGLRVMLGLHTIRVRARARGRVKGRNRAPRCG